MEKAVGRLGVACGICDVGLCEKIAFLSFFLDSCISQGGDSVTNGSLRDSLGHPGCQARYQKNLIDPPPLPLLALSANSPALLL